MNEKVESGSLGSEAEEVDLIRVDSSLDIGALLSRLDLDESVKPSQELRVGQESFRHHLVQLRAES